MTTKKADLWTPVDSLPDDFDGWISRATFGFMQEYQGGQTPLLLLDVESEDVELSRPIAFSIGNGWSIGDQGQTIQGEKPDKRITRNSKYGRLLVRVVNELGVDMRARGEPTTASVWEGLGFHWKREELDYSTGGGAILAETGGKTQQVMPTAYLGDRTAKKAVAAPAARTRAAAKKEAPTEDGLTAKLTKMAKLMELEPFQTAALGIPELQTTANAALMAAVLEDSNDGFWAQARG